MMKTRLQRILKELGIAYLHEALTTVLGPVVVFIVVTLVCLLAFFFAWYVTTLEGLSTTSRFLIFIIVPVLLGGVFAFMSMRRK